MRVGELGVIKKEILRDKLERLRKKSMYGLKFDSIQHL